MKSLAEATAPRGREPEPRASAIPMTKTSQTIPLPPPVDGAPGIPKTERYREQYGVIVICADETDQRAVYERLTADRLKCKVVTV